MNDHRAVIVGLCDASDTFQTFPILYTRYHQAIQFVPQERRVLSAIFVHAEDGVDPHEVCRRIEAQTKQKGRYGREFAGENMPRRVCLDDAQVLFMKRTGIIVNFSITVTLGFIVGVAIAGQTFYTFTLENLTQFGSLKAMGVTNLPSRRHGAVPGRGGGLAGLRGCGDRTRRYAVRLNRCRQLQQTGAFYMPFSAGAGRHRRGGGHHIRDGLGPGEHSQGAGSGTSGRFSRVTMSTAVSTEAKAALLDQPTTAVVCRAVTKEFGEGDTQVMGAAARRRHGSLRRPE